VREQPTPVWRADQDSLRTASRAAIASLYELANALDDCGLPSMTIDNIRLELSAIMARTLQRAQNDNQGDPT
jgi:hypothetical protein